MHGIFNLDFKKDVDLKQRKDAHKPTTDNMATAPIPAPTSGHLQELIHVM